MNRITATKAAQELLAEIEAQHGPVLFHLSGGCCDGSAPMVYPAGEFRIGSHDVQLGQIGDAPFWTGGAQAAAWADTDLIVDAVPGRGRPSASTMCWTGISCCGRPLAPADPTGHIAGQWMKGDDMAHKVFIDGEAGTTGLQIRDRLAPRRDIELVQLDPARRKDPLARHDALAEADIAILCLPDAAAREAVELAAGLPVRFIDASTAHRVAPGWVFGFPELAPGAREAIASAARVSNPGCYSTGAIALAAPLVAAGLVAPDEIASINAVSGYSGGGKELIAEMEAPARPRISPMRWRRATSTCRKSCAMPG